LAKPAALLRPSFEPAFATVGPDAANARTTAVPAGSPACAWRRRRTTGAVTRPSVAPSVTCPQPSTDSFAPAPAATGDPSIASPVALPRPALAWTLLAVTTPPNNETEVSSTTADEQPEPLMIDELKARTDEYAEGPRNVAGVPSAMTRPEGSTRAAAPAPTHVAGNDEEPSGANDCVVVVVVVVVVAVPVVVVSVPAARADATPRAATATTGSTSQRTRRITEV
jgi:hypothetical protein